MYSGTFEAGIDLRLSELNWISRSGLCSVSDDDCIVTRGAVKLDTSLGEPSDFLDKKPALNRSFLECMVARGSGVGAIGDDFGESASIL